MTMNKRSTTCALKCCFYKKYLSSVSFSHSSFLQTTFSNENPSANPATPQSSVEFQKRGLPSLKGKDASCI